MADSEFLVMGTLVSFKLRGRREVIDAPDRLGLIHCASGSEWPRCVLMVGPFQRGDEIPSSEVSLAARKFLRTDDYKPHEGSFTSPRVDSDSWRVLGSLQKIWYLRQGALDFYLKHEFKRRQFLVFPAETTLAKLGSWWKITMPRLCIINERGIVSP